MRMALNEELATSITHDYGGFRYEMTFWLLKYTLEGEYVGKEKLET